jgi:Zn-dependent M28 family amino/carboxypeptidase
MARSRIALYLGAILVLLLATAGWYASAFMQEAAAPTEAFDGQRALRDVQTQVAFGPRIPGSEAHTNALNWMRGQLVAAGWQVETQSLSSMGHPIQNLIASRSAEAPEIILGAHYDSRLHADRDPTPALRSLPVPGADDGASGVAVLLELARILPKDAPPVWLVFFDAEDNGDIPGWDWLLGSRAFVANLTSRPKEMILVDMVGASDLKIPIEANSDPALRAAVWNTAKKLGYESTFLPQVKYTIEDDHVPFLQAGIPAVDIIDLDYAYWHTTSDTADQVSARSLQIVGDVLEKWLREQAVPAG